MIKEKRHYNTTFMTVKSISTVLLLVFFSGFGEAGESETEGQVFYCRNRTLKEMDLPAYSCKMNYVDLIDFQKTIKNESTELLSEPIHDFHFKNGKMSTVWKLLANRIITRKLKILKLKNVAFDIEQMTLSRGYFPDLTDLYLENSQIVNISKSFDFEKGFQVNVLFLKNNKIKYLFDGSLHNIRILVLSGNPIHDFANTAFKKRDHFSPNPGLSVLQHLYMKSCALTSLQRHMFRGLNRLTLIDLSHNNIHHIEKYFFDEIKQVEKLNLSYNDISSALTIQGSPKLKYLDLSANRITSLTFNGTFGKLTDLLLNDNNLRDISKIPFNEMLQLKTLSLDMNEIEDIDPFLFASNKQLQKVILRSTKYINSNGHRRTAAVFCNCPKTSSKSQILHCALQFNLSDYQVTRSRTLKFSNTKCEVMFTQPSNKENNQEICQKKATRILLVVLLPIAFGAVLLASSIVTFVWCKWKRGGQGTLAPVLEFKKETEIKKAEGDMTTSNHKVADKPKTHQPPQLILCEKKDDVYEQPTTTPTTIPPTTDKPRKISPKSFLNRLPKRPSLKWLYEKDYKEIHFPFQNRRSTTKKGRPDRGGHTSAEPMMCSVDSENTINQTRQPHIYENLPSSHHEGCNDKITTLLLSECSDPANNKLEVYEFWDSKSKSFKIQTSI